MLRDNLNRQLKYSIRKKKNGGGAASFVVGSVIFGGLMLGNVMSVNADEVASSSTNGDTTVTSNQMNENKDISGKEVTLSKPNTVETTANQKEGASAVSSDNVVSTTTMNQNESGSTENSENPVDPTNEKQTANETTDTKSSGTDVKNDNLTQSPTNARNLVAAAATVPESQLANNKVTISNFKVNKHLIKESEGLDINFSFDWSGQGLVKGDTLVVPLSDAFTSITRQVPTPFFESNGQQVGTMVLDYDAKKIYTKFTANMDPNRIYNGTINVGTFINRNYFINKDNKNIVELDLPNGQKEAVDLQIVFDVKDAAPDLGIITVQANKNTDNPDGSTNITWDAIVNSDKKQMSDAAIYVTPDVIKGISPQFEVPYDNYTGWTDMNFKYDSNSKYSLDEDSFRVYQANVYASMGYAKEKELVKGQDYEIHKSNPDVMPHAYAIYLIGKYATTSSPIVVEYSGTIPVKNGNINQATTDAFVAYNEGTIVKRYSTYTRYDGPFTANWAHGFIDVNNSSITGSTQNILGSVSVVHIDATTGKLLKPEAYVEKDGTPLHNVEQGTKYKTTAETFPGYKFTSMGYDSAPAEGTVKEGHQRVIYLYVPETPTPEEKKGSVDVTYVAEDGKVLKETSDVVKDGEIGSSYETEQKSFDGYTFKRMGEFSADATGKVEEGTKHVVYIYAKNPETPEEKKGNVDVKYITTDGKVLEDVTSVKENAPVGEDYTTEEKGFTGYHFVGMDKTSDPATGVVAEGTKHVIYVYEKDVTPEVKKGNVDVTYVAEDGKVLKETSDVVKDGEIGSSYETEQKSFDGYTFKRMGEFSADATGKVEEGTKHVVYIYAKNPETPEEKKGNVDVKYITTDGKVLEDVTSVKENAPVGEDYTTEEKGFTGYHFVGMDKTSDPATGVVAEGTKHVIYVYEKDVTPEVKKGNVDVTYVAEDGKVLKETSDVVKDGEIGSSYETEQKSFDGYTFKRMGEFSADATGKVEEGTKHVVYIYAKNPETPEEKKGNVDVKYITTDGKVLEDVTSVKENAPVGEDYTTEEKGFTGYHFVGMDKTSDPATGVVAEGTKHVIYVYEKDVTPEVKKGNVDVTYVAEDGKVLKETSDVVKDGEIGSSYETEQKSFDGYTFKRMGEFSADATGKVEEGTKHVVYIYAKNPETPEEKKGNVDVKYITTDGKVLEDVTSVKENAPVGEDYTTEEKGFTGYHFVGMDKTSDPATGVVAEGTKHVIYVYEKDVTPEVKKGNVDVTYVAEDGKVLKETSDVVKDGEIGSSYETEQKSFDGYTFKRMGEFSADATGKVEEGTKHVVYIYAKNPETPEEKKGNVDVKYITTDGKVLEDVTSVKENAPVGEDYTTEEKGFTGYHFVGMDKTSDPATGVVAEGTKHVIYVYEKDVTPEVKKGNVDVTYVAEDGKVLKETSDVVKDGEIGSSYETEQKSFDGYTFKRMGEFSADATGKVEEGTKHVVYIYAKNPETPEEKKGNVDVKYITTDGKVLEDVTSVKENAPVGEDYTTEEKGFTGYHFVGMDKTSDPATGVVAEGTKHVIYVYEKDVTPEVKKGNVDVTYVAEDGKVLKETSDVVKDGEIGSSYETEQKSFDGYTFKRMGEFSADATGKVEEGTKHVVYIYAKNPETPEEKKGNVDVKYITTDGKVLEDVTSVKENAPVGEDYTTEEKGFTGYHFVGMDKTSDPATGVVAEGTKHVIYVYEKDVTPEVKKGSVDVTYVAEDGKVLKETSDVVKDGEIGSSYETEQKSFDGYTFKRMGEFSADATGKVEEGTKHVVYIYAKNPETPEEKKGNVDVKYITTDGKVLEDVTSVKENAPVGEDYTTEEKGFTGYHFVGMDKTSDLATGVVAEGTKHVIYVYEKDVTPEVKKGSVDVKYVTTDGKVLEDVTKVKDNAPVGEAYTTEEKSFDGYHFVGMDKTSDSANGKVTEGDKHVVYVYEKDETPEVKKGSVDVKYVTTDGKVLEDVTKVKDNAPVGEAYTTEEKSFDGYHFVGMDKTSDSANGKVTEGDKHVVYVYEKDETPEVKKGSVDVKYVTTDGKVLEDVTKVKDNAPVGEAYTTEEKSFDGYHFVGMDKTSDSANGKVTEGDKHVVYVYEKDETPEVKKGSVDVKYVTTDGKVLEDVTKVKDNAPVGEAYTTEEKSFDGYHFVGMDKTSDSANGKVTEGDKHVVYVYEKDETPEVKKGSVDVKYVTTDGKVLEDVTKVKDNAPVGEAYTTEEKSFDGYHFVGMDKTSDSANGKVTEGDKHVVYVYEKDETPEVKKGSVDVKYVTTDGKVLEDVTKVKDNAPVGEAYTTEEKSFDGYHFVGMDKTSDSANGKVTEGDKHVVYVYEKDETPEVKKGSVDVKYVTTDGKVLEDVTKVKDNAPVGEAYTTEEKSFDGYHFVGMDKTSDSANGKVTEGDKHVVYVYEKDETPEVKKGSVDVKYVTTDGKVLEDVTKVKDNAPVGEAYTTEEKSFDGYHFVGMDRTSDSANGKVTEGDKHVVYVYEKDETPEVKKGSVDVKYVTTDGKVLEDITKVKDNAPVGETYTTEEKSFDGYHFVGMDKTSDSANGKVTEGDKHIVYVYEKDETPEVKKGSVDVKYVTTDGKVLEDVTKVKDNAPVGEAYTTEEKSFDGYHFVGMDRISDSANGKVTEGDKHVVYVYEKDETPEVKKGNVDVTYVTEDGKVLEATTDVVKDGEVGTEYTTEKKNFDGYSFSRMGEFSAEVTGQVEEGTKHVVYVYTKNPEEKKGSVYVKYVDENGNELPGGEKTIVIKDGKVGSYYFTTGKDFDGYTFSHMSEDSANATGKVIEGEQLVVYVYTKNNTPQPEPSEPEVPAPSEKPETPQEESKDVTDVPTKTSTSKVNAEKVTVNKATVLPQTGDKKENNSSVMGLVSLGLAGLLGLGIKRKEEKDNH